MQVRHVEVQQLDLAKAEQAQLELPPAAFEEKPLDEVLQCVALLAAIHMQPCHTATARDEDKKKKAGGAPEE